MQLPPPCWAAKWHYSVTCHHPLALLHGCHLSGAHMHPVEGAVSVGAAVDVRWELVLDAHGLQWPPASVPMTPAKSAVVAI